MIEIRDLTVEFSGGVKALDQVNLSVNQGRNTIVVGESGSGKSAMLSAILHILPGGAKVTGSVCLEGEEMIGLSEKAMNRIRGRKMSYVGYTGCRRC